MTVMQSHALRFYRRCLVTTVTSSRIRRSLSSRAAPTALIFDTETTTKANFKLPPSDPTQPDLVQLGMILVDTSNWTTRSQVSLLVDLRRGVTIDAGAEDTHGISKEECNRFGVHPNTAAAIFNDFYRSADVLVAHNLTFDAIVMAAALHRSGENKEDDGDGDGKQRVCTMLASTDVLKIPGRFGNHKWPSLAEAYTFVTDEELEGGHDALVDANACLSVFQYLVEKNIVSLDEVAHSSVISEGDIDSTCSAKGTREETEGASNRPKDIFIQLTENGFTVRGNTYTAKETIKAYGGRWDGARREWAFSDRTSLSDMQRLAGGSDVVP